MEKLMELETIVPIALFFLAFLFTLLPLVPGTFFVVAGAIFYEWIHEGSDFGVYFWLMQAILVIGYLFLDNIAQLLGIKKFGGSRAGMWGGAIGCVVGPCILAPLIGPFAIVFGPLLGGMTGTIYGEMHTNKNRSEIMRASWGSAVSYVVGVMLKMLCIVFQIVLFYGLINI
jgi:uncharacterized protein YqgC (DUF456 family)